jgi:hypothetical protein
MDDNNKCESCLYWRRKGVTMSGKCHRHAPRRIPSKDSGYVNDWAMTNQDDFCGEFSPAAPTSTKAEKSESVPIKEIFKPQQKQQPSLEGTQPRQ